MNDSVPRRLERPDTRTPRFERPGLRTTGDELLATQITETIDWIQGYREVVILRGLETQLRRDSRGDWFGTAILTFGGADTLLHVAFFTCDCQIQEPEPTQHDGDGDEHGKSYNDLNSSPVK